MGALAETLNVRLPMAAFNGGSLVMPDLSLLQAHRLAADVARRMLTLLAERRVDPWVFACDDWRLRDPNEPYVGREIRAIGYGPVTVDGFEDVIHHIDKIVRRPQTTIPCWPRSRSRPRRCWTATPPSTGPSPTTSTSPTRRPTRATACGRCARTLASTSSGRW